MFTEVSFPGVPDARVDARLCGYKALASNASDTANMITPPTPRMPRDNWSISVLVAKPHSTDAPVNTTQPDQVQQAAAVDVREAARREQERRQGQRVSVDDPLQVRETRVQGRWMSGRATFTIVMSSSSMNVPRHTATSVHHLLPR
jgi:hypothetical protein